MKAKTTQGLIIVSLIAATVAVISVNPNLSGVSFLSFPALLVALGWRFNDASGNVLIMGVMFAVGFLIIFTLMISLVIFSSLR